MQKIVLTNNVSLCRFFHQFRYAGQEEYEPCKNAAIYALFCKFSDGVHTVLPSSPLQQIIKNIGVFVACKSNVVFLD